MKYHLQTSFLPVICLVALLSNGCPLSNSKNELEPVGPDVKAHLLIYFNTGISRDEIDAFHKTVLSRPDPEGRGHYLAPGIGLLLRIGPVEGHEGFAITFSPNATADQRQDLIKAVKASPVVYKVLENATPDDVKTLE